MNYQNLTAAINAVIKTNNRREITGQILQNVLGQMVGSLGENYQLVGMATPLTNPGTPDQNVFYFANQQGVYSHFGDIQLDAGLNVLKWKNGAWTVDTLTSGLVTREWVDSNYVSIAFFRQLFRAYNDNDVEIMPNDLTGIVGNIKAMVGLWTEQYISALGQGTGGGGGGCASALSDLLDVELTTLQNGQALVYSSALGKWTNGTAGVNMTQVWSALGSATNEQINISHLTGALAPYAETSYVDTQINNTKTWVGQNFITIAFFDRLFRAYNGDTLVNANDTTTTIDNIKAMFGFWTEQYLSALGQNAGGGGGIVLAEPLQSINSAGLGMPQSANVGLVWDGTEWTYSTTGGTDMPTVWTNLAAATNEQINISHLSTALSGYALTSQLLNYNPTNNFKTINGQTIIGTGDISVGGGASGNYLPLSGGTLVGNLTLPLLTNAWGFILGNYRNNGSQVSIGNYSSVDNIVSGFNFIANNTRTVPFDYTLFDSGWSSTVKMFKIAGDGFVTINAFNTSETGIIFREGIESLKYNMSILSYPVGGSAPDGLSINANGGVTFCTGGNIRNERMRITSNGYVGIGISSPSYKLHVEGTIYATGNVTALSDARHKTIIKDATINVEQIARMPAVVYRWNDGREDNSLHVGSIAQDWQMVLPEVVLRANDKEGTLSMQYGVAALVSSIITARKVVDHERRIKELEEENKKLKLKLKIA